MHDHTNTTAMAVHTYNMLHQVHIRLNFRVVGVASVQTTARLCRHTTHDTYTHTITHMPAVCHPEIVDVDDGRTAASESRAKLRET